MSRLFILLSLLSILSIPIFCSEAFNEKYLECYLKMEKFRDISRGPFMIGHTTSKLIDQCYSAHECFKELTKVETSNKNQTKAAEEMVDYMSTTCKFIHILVHNQTELFNSQPKYIQCFSNNFFEIWNLKEEALAVNPEEGCELTSDQMLTVRSIVLKKCGVSAYRELREHENIVKESLCGEEVKKTMKKFIQYYKQENKF